MSTNFHNFFPVKFGNELLLNYRLVSNPVSVQLYICTLVSARIICMMSGCVCLIRRFYLLILSRHSNAEAVTNHSANIREYVHLSEVVQHTVPET